MKFKKILLLFFILANLPLNGCNAGNEINTLGIAVSMGIDKSQSGYTVTYQVINPKAIASKKSVNESPTILYTESGKDLFAIERKITEQSPRTIYVQHLRNIIISEDIAKEGVRDIIEFMDRSPYYRGVDVFFIIAKNTTANKLLSVLTPLEAVSANETTFSLEASEKVWAPTKRIRILELANGIASDGTNNVVTSIEIINSKNNETSIDTLKQTDTEKLKISDLGVFKKDKLAGWLNEDESKGYNYIIGNVKDTAGYLQYDDKNQISVEVTNTQSKIKAYLLNNKPAISVQIDAKLSIAAQTGDFDLSDEDTVEKIDKMQEEKIKGLCIAVLKYTQDELRTDIFGFGEEIHRAYPKLWKEIKSDWNNEFAKIPVSIKVNVQTENTGEQTKSFFMKEQH